MTPITLPKLHIRDLFWLVLAVAMGLGWWASERRSAERVRIAEKRTSEAELEAFYYVQSASMAGVKLPLYPRDE